MGRNLAQQRRWNRNGISVVRQCDHRAEPSMAAAVRRRAGRGAASGFVAALLTRVLARFLAATFAFAVATALARKVQTLQFVQIEPCQADRGFAIALIALDR